ARAVERPPRGRPEARRGEGDARAPARLVDLARDARARGARDGLREAGRAAVHREGDRAVAAARAGHHGGARCTLARAASPADRAIVAAQLGREPRAFRRVAVRCPFGRPAVTEQSPYDPDGEPFPTTYYVTCRHLVAAVSRLEAAGGVERWSAAAVDDPELAA